MLRFARSLIFFGQIIDSGDLSGVALCADEEIYGLKLMQTLPADLQQKAQVHSTLQSESMPEGRWNPADQVDTKSPARTTHRARKEY